jgi:hypothetical protein
MAHDVWGLRIPNAALLGGPPFAILTTMLLAIVPRGRVSRWQRGLLVAVVVQMLVCPVTAYLLGEVSRVFGLDFSKAAPRASAVVVGGLGLATVAWAALNRGRRVPAAMTALGALSLAYSLVLALSLPIAARALADEILPLEWILLACVVPAVATAAWVALSRRSIPDWAAQALLFAVVAATTLDIVVVPAMRTEPFLAMIKGVNWLLASSSVTTAAMSMVAFMQWWSLRGIGDGHETAGDGGAVRGTVEADHDVVGWFTYLGMLRGMRIEHEAFHLRPDHGGNAIPIPAESVLVAPLPAAALDPKPGDRIPALRRGDTVVVRGFVQRGSGGFRDHAGPVVGAGGLHVVRAHESVDAPDRRSRFDEVLLGMWRPFVLYVAVATAGSLPIVVALVLGLVDW